MPKALLEKEDLKSEDKKIYDDYKQLYQESVEEETAIEELAKKYNMEYNDVVKIINEEIDKRTK